MITEQKLNEIGKDKYVAFVELIMALLERKVFRSTISNPSTTTVVLDNIYSAEQIEDLAGFAPTEETPITLKIPGESVSRTISDKLEDAIECLINDLVLKRFVDAESEHNLIDAPFQYAHNELGYLNRGTHVEFRCEEWDIIVAPRMTVAKIEQYVDEVRLIGVPKPESATNTKGLRLEFDEEIGVLSFGKNQYSFHRGKQQSRDKDRLALMKKLWPKRMRIGDKGLNNKISGSSIALELRFCKSMAEFDSNKNMKERLKNLIGGINRSMKSNHIPAKIMTAGGIQLVELNK